MSLFESTSKPKFTIRRFVRWFVSFVLLACAAFAFFAPTPYLVENPGPVYNLFSTNSGKPWIAISGKETFPTAGSLNLLTVTLSGTSARGASWFEIGLAKLDSSKKILNITDVYPPGWDDAQLNQESDVMMLDSQANAKAAALNLLHIHYDSYLTVTMVDLKGAAGKVLKAGDRVLKVGGNQVKDLNAIKQIIGENKGKAPIAIEVLRAGKHLIKSVTPRFVDGQWRIGVYISPVPQFPFSINIDLGNVGGPSGGQMMALAIYDLLTPGALTGGKDIAGTGTVDEQGNIGPIGGIVQKMYAARGRGIHWFLAPSANCSEVVGNIPDGISVVKVSNLRDSLSAVRAIAKGEGTLKLPRCTK